MASYQGCGYHHGVIANAAFIKCVHVDTLAGNCGEGISRDAQSYVVLIALVTNTREVRVKGTQVGDEIYE